MKPAASIRVIGNKVPSVSGRGRLHRLRKNRWLGANDTREREHTLCLRQQFLPIAACVQIHQAPLVTLTVGYFVKTATFWPRSFIAPG